MSTLSTTNIKHPSSASNNIVLDSSGRVSLGTGITAQPLAISYTGSGNFSPTSSTELVTKAGLTVNPDSNGSSAIFSIAKNSDGHALLQASNGSGSSVYDLSLNPYGNIRFNSGFGSSAIAYGCRAWISFDASSGTPTIQASGNISSITDNGTGQFKFNFTSSFPDANYAVVGMTQDGTSGLTDGGECARIGDRTTTDNTMSFTSANESSFADNKRNCVLWMR